MKVFLSLCLLFSLVSPAVLLTCRKCENYGRTACTAKESEKCYIHTLSCKSAVISGDLLRRISRADYSCSECEAGNYAFNTGSKGFFNMAVRCCKSDECNAESLESPSQPMEPNGLECKGCYANFPFACNEEVVKCTGNQTKCIKLNAYTIGYGSTRAKGCATPDMCNEDRLNSNFPFKEDMTSFSVKCQDAVSP